MYTCICAYVFSASSVSQFRLTQAVNCEKLGLTPSPRRNRAKSEHHKVRVNYIHIAIHVCVCLRACVCVYI